MGSVALLSREVGELERLFADFLVASEWGGVSAAKLK